MFPIQPRRRRQRDEELTAVRVRPAVRHAQHARARMFQRRVDLVGELVAVDGAAAAAGAGGVAGLEHEVRDYAVDGGVVVVAALGEGGEVFAGLGWGVRLGGRKDGMGGGLPWAHGRCRARPLLSPWLC